MCTTVPPAKSRVPRLRIHPISYSPEEFVQPDHTFAGVSRAQTDAGSAYPVSDGVVDDGTPDGNEEHVGEELHALDDCTGYQRGSDDGKHELEDAVSIGRDRGRKVRVRGLADIIEAGPSEASKTRCSGTKGERKTEHEPLNGYHGD